MTITAVQQSINDKTVQLVAKQAQITALGIPTSDSQRQLLKQYQEEFVRGCIDARKVNPTSIITTIGASVFSAAWLAKYHPEIAALTAQVTAGVTSGDVQDQLFSARMHAIDDAMAQGITTASAIISACSWNT